MDGLQAHETIPDEVDAIARIIVQAAYRIHVHLGPACLESAYAKLMEHELRKAGLAFVREAQVPIEYDGQTFDVDLKADFIVEGCVVVELKAVERLHPVHFRQTLTYMRLTGCRVGLLINFGEMLVRDGIHRLAL